MESQIGQAWIDEPQTPLFKLARATQLITQLLPELTEQSRAKADEAIKLLVILSNGEIKISEGRSWCVEVRLGPGPGAGADPPQEAIRLMYERYSWPQGEANPTLASQPRVLATIEACGFVNYILSRQDEFAETTKRVEAEMAERERAWKEHQAKQL